MIAEITSVFQLSAKIVMYCTSGFVDDVMFAHNGLYGVWLRAYSQIDSPGGRTGGEAMTPTTALLLAW